MSEARDKLLSTALQLFIEDGLHAVGIDKVVKVSGVSKMTLYKYFPSKDFLIESALTLYHHQLLSELKEEVAGAPPGLEPQLFSLLAWYKSRFLVGDDSRGCLFVSAVNMYPSQDHPVHRVCLLHKSTLIDLFAMLLGSYGYKNPASLALQCLILFEGAQNLTAIGVRGGAIDSAASVIMVLLNLNAPCLNSHQE